MINRVFIDYHYFIILILTSSFIIVLLIDKIMHFFIINHINLISKDFKNLGCLFYDYIYFIYFHYSKMIIQ